MKPTRNLQKKEKSTENRNEQGTAKTTNNMTIEEAREAERTFNEELRIFRKVTEMNRSKQKGR